MAEHQIIQIDLTDNSGMVKEEFQAACLRSLEKCGLTGERYAKDLCPTRTSTLKNSITHQVQPSKLEVYIGSNVEYAA